MSNLRRSPRTMVLALAASILTLAVAAQAQEMSEQEMMAAYMEAATPGSEHEMLAKSAGNWNVTMKSWMAPGADPMVSEGTETGEMILGGRYLKSEFSGTTMGMPFNGFGLIGYDNVSKKYVGTWCDSMGTGIMRYEGTYDEQDKVLTCKGDYIDPATGETVTATLISRIIDDDHHVFEMWSPGPDGQPMKWMEMDYRRAM
jgi:hypothetical protein